LRAVFSVCNISGVKDPGDFELGHIFAIDLSQPRIPHAASVAAIIRPVLSEKPRGNKTPQQGETQRQTQAKTRALYRTSHAGQG
jgi:hypothetical protein